MIPSDWPNYISPLDAHRFTAVVERCLINVNDVATSLQGRGLSLWAGALG